MSARVQLFPSPFFAWALEWPRLRNLLRCGTSPVRSPQCVDVAVEHRPAALSPTNRVVAFIHRVFILVCRDCAGPAVGCAKEMSPGCARVMSLFPGSTKASRRLASPAISWSGSWPLPILAASSASRPPRPCLRAQARRSLGIPMTSMRRAFACLPCFF